MNDLLSLLETVLGQSERRSRGNVRFKCPLPGCTSVRNRLEIQTETNESGDNPWKCWVCLKGGLSIKSLFRQARVDPRYYQQLNSITGNTSTRVYTPEEIISLPDEFKSLSDVKNTDFVGRRALVYVKGRGFTPEMILKYQLGYCDAGKYSNRVIFPSYDISGNVNYFAARSLIDDEEKRYLFPEVKRGDIIPFELFINWNAPIILCEGPFDAAAILRNTIPLLEKGITQALLSKILGSDVNKIYIVLDKDGMKEALEHAGMMLANGKTVYLVELDQKDPSKMGFKDFTMFVQKARPLTDESLFMKKMLFKLS